MSKKTIPCYDLSGPVVAYRTQYGTFRPNVAEQRLHYSTEIWYMNDEGWRKFGNWALKDSERVMPTPDNLHETHTLLGTTDETVLENVFKLMQNWSSVGESNVFIHQKGLRHTSMSVGDVIKIGTRAWMVAGIGFEELT